MADLRMPNLNQVIIAARLTRDPESRSLANGQTVCKIGLAQSRKYKTASGEEREETLFINATAWGKTAEYAASNLRKGRPVIVTGRLKMDEWDDRTTGTKRTAIEISAERVDALDWEERGDSKKPAPAMAATSPVDDDSLPF